MKGPSFCDKSIEVIKNPLRTKNKLTPYCPEMFPKIKWTKCDRSTIKIATNLNPSSFGIYFKKKIGSKINFIIDTASSLVSSMHKKYWKYGP